MTTSTIRRAVAIVLGVGIMAGAADGQPPPYRIDQVHADVVVQYAGGAWEGFVETTGGVYPPAVPPQDAILVANPSSITTRSASTQFNFIGVGAGQTYWRLQQTQNSNQLFLGVGAEEMDAAGPGGPWSTWDLNRNFPDGSPYPVGQWVELQVRDVRGPDGGHFSMWQSTDDGPDVFVSTFLNGYQSPGNRYLILVGSHTHYNWGFTVQGEYEIDVVARTFFDGGGGPVELASDPENPFTFRFDVVPVPEPAAAWLGCVAVVAISLGRWGRHRRAPFVVRSRRACEETTDLVPDRRSGTQRREPPVRRRGLCRRATVPGP